MNKKPDTVSTDILISDALLRLKALENLLVSKGILTAAEITAEQKQITRLIAKDLLVKAQVKGDIDKILDELEANETGN